MIDNDYLIKGEMYQYNLGWLIEELLSFKQDLATAIDLKTIKYADPIQWDITTQYPANTVVVDPKSGTAYMSKVPVPAGVELTNTNYWVVVFNYQDIYNKIMDGVAFNDRNQDYATKDLLVNDLVWYAGDLYRVTRAIPTGSKYIPGTNLIKTSIESLLARYYGRDRTAQVSNDTINVSGDYTLAAGDIAETSDNTTIKNTKDRNIDVDGDFTISTPNLDLNISNPVKFQTPQAFNEFFNAIDIKGQDNNLYKVLAYNKNTQMMPGLFTSPEKFGASGDGIADDTSAWKQCISDAKTNNLIISTKNKKYIISEDLIFDKVNAFSLGTLICKNCKIIVQNASIVKYFTLVNGPLVMDAYYSEVSNFTIKNYDGVCISFQSINELPDASVGFGGLHDFLIDNYELHSINAVGINCNQNDLKIWNGGLVNCNTGIIWNGGNILLKDIHMWVNSYVDFETTVAFDIRQTNFRIINCTIDTYKQILKLSSGYLNGIIEGTTVIHNTVLFKNVNIQFINQKHCTILGNITFKMSNWEKNNIALTLYDNAKCNIQFIDGMPSDKFMLNQSDLTSTQGGTITSEYGVSVDSKQIWIDINIVYPGAGLPNANTDIINLGDLIEAYRAKYSGFLPAMYRSSASSEFTPGLAKVYVQDGNLKITPTFTTLFLKEIHIQMPIKLGA